MLTSMTTGLGTQCNLYGLGRLISHHKSLSNTPAHARGQVHDLVSDVAEG